MLMGRYSMSIKKPMILVIAGSNGSGKSTFIQYFEKIGEYTNADDVGYVMLEIKNRALQRCPALQGSVLLFQPFA